MGGRPSTRRLACTLLLVLCTVTAGCPNPWQSTEYEALGRVVSDPPDGATVVSHTDSSVRSEEVVQQVVAEAIVTYLNRTGTPAPRRLYDASRDLRRDQYRETSGTIDDLDDYPGDDESAIYIERAGYIVRVWTRKVQLV